MGKGDYLGEFQGIVLLALARQEQATYGMGIRQEIECRTGRDVSIGAVYSALDRMERKGYVSSWVGAPTPERGGKAKRFYRLERSGWLALLRTRDMSNALWEGLEVDTDLLRT